MDRQIVYIGQIPQDTDVLNTNLDSYIGQAKLAAAVLGTSQLINGGACTPTSPTSLSVKVAAVEIYSLQNVDDSGYGSIPLDTTHQIVKQGVNLDTTTLSCPAPATVGNSINYLIQYGFSETDGGSTVLPYYNASNPAQAFSGPGNDGQPNNTIRQDQVNVTVKAGVSAPTGTQVTSSPDSGFSGGYVVTVAQGQTTITSGDISLYSGAPFITETLTQKISQTTADARYTQATQIQSGILIYGVDSSVSANTLTVTLSPAITSYTAGMEFNIKVANTNSGASTININGLGAKNIKLSSGANPTAGDLLANAISILFYDGTNFQLLNPQTVSFSASPIQNSSYVYIADSGAVNAYAATLAPAVASYVAGLQVFIKIANTNTSTTTTLNVNSLGTKSIKLTNGSNINIGDLLSGMVARLIYDGTNFQLINPASYASQQGVQNSSYNYSVDGGSANAYTVTLTPAPASYTNGMIVLIKISNTNTGTSTINVNSLGAKTIKNGGGSNLNAGILQSGGIYSLSYDGTNFVIVGSLSKADISFFAYRAASTQAIPDSTFTKVNFSQENIDTNNNYDTSTYRFTATRAGRYWIYGQFQWDQAGATSNNFRIDIYVNGVSTGYSNVRGIAGSSYVNMGGVYNLTVNDYVEIYAFQDSGVSKNITADTSNFSGFLIN
jgi:hypothetical protein